MGLLEYIRTIPKPVLFGLFVFFALMTVYLGFEYARSKKLDGLRDDCYKLFRRAEKIFTSSGAGRGKMKWVLVEFRKTLPPWVAMFMTEAMLAEIVQKWFTGIKDLLDDGKVNQSAKIEIIPDEDAAE